MNNPPKITLVTPSLNQAEFLEETIQSILSQNYPNLEYIIVDGGSTDGSVEIIKRYEQHLAWWVSELDWGQSHALNKGLDSATGEIFNWVNSDDLLAPGALEAVAKEFENHPLADIVCGHYTAISKGQMHPRLRLDIFEELEKTMIFGHVSPCCMFWRMRAIREIGRFDERLDYCMDLEFWHRYLLKNGLSGLHTFDRELAIFRFHNNSKSIIESEGFRKDRFNLQFSLINSLDVPGFVHSHFKSTGIELYYENSWDTQKISPKKYAAYALQDMAQQLFKRMNYLIFLKTFLLSLLLLPFKRGLHFYILPVRRISWWLKGYQ
jgi:glycosyltransferase involved in cell wall biosynthesis